jgi:hypothetical protein
MKTLVSAAIAAALLMAAAPAGAAINGGFEAPGATTSATFSGAGGFLVNVAPNWNAYNNSAATTTVGEVSTATNPDPFAPAGFKMFSVTSNGTNDGLYQLPGSFGFLSADFFVLSGSAQLVAATSIGGYLSTVATTANNTWQHLTLNTNAGAGEITLYTFGAGTFYVDNVVSGAYQPDAGASSVTSWSGGVPEPASWALMIVGFASAGAMLRYRRRAALAA